MADHHHGARVVGEHLLQKIERLEIEIVGRLVEDEEVGGPRQGPRQHQPAAFAARELPTGVRACSGLNRKSFI